MSHTVKYNNKMISDYCKVIDIRTPGLPERTNFTRDIPKIDGLYYDGFKYGARFIEIDIVVTGDNLDGKINSIMKILHQGTPAKLETSKEPNIYYMAVPDGTFIPENTFTTRRMTLKFMCPDAKAYNKTKKTFSMTK
jgi:predicted phage tail component-like protein